MVQPLSHSSQAALGMPGQGPGDTGSFLQGGLREAQANLIYLCFALWQVPETTFSSTSREAPRQQTSHLPLRAHVMVSIA